MSLCFAFPFGFGFLIHFMVAYLIGPEDILALLSLFGVHLGEASKAFGEGASSPLDSFFF